MGDWAGGWVLCLGLVGYPVGVWKRDSLGRRMSSNLKTKRVIGFSASRNPRLPYEMTSNFAHKRLNDCGQSLRPFSRAPGLKAESYVYGVRVSDWNRKTGPFGREDELKFKVKARNRYSRPFRRLDNACGKNLSSFT